MGADYSFYVKSIATCAPTFFGEVYYFSLSQSVLWLNLFFVLRMPFDDFLTQFSEMSICRLINTSLFSFNKTWNESQLFGSWIKVRIYSEKATKFWEISTIILSYVVPVRSKVEILQNFVAFSEYMNFKGEGNYNRAGGCLNNHELFLKNPQYR